MATVVGLFDNSASAQAAIEQLRTAGIPSDQISLAMRDRTTAAAVAEEQGVGTGVATGAVGGGILGGLAGLLVGIGALAIPGIGPLIAAGPLAATLLGAGIGAATGGLIGALVGAGVPEEDAVLYQQGVERGGVLVT
ncbi:MAG TPA: general stress protein, partial [Chloroflexia bacterium]|nr:general stress protein [Chloroflexia bacterium]